MEKAALRKLETARRKALDALALRTLSEQLLEQFTQLDFTGIHTLHIFLPIAEKREPDTFLLIDWLRQQHPDIHLVVPKADFNTLKMSHHSFKGMEGLKKNVFNILEPVDDVAYAGKIDMVIVPLLAFDKRGYRVGYGKGFYDRFLQQHPAIKVGLSLFESVDIISDIHADDIRLDMCITPKGRIYF